MRTRIFTILAVSVIAFSVVGPASAADNSSKWRDGFPAASSINANLGNYKSNPDIEISNFTGRWYVCSTVRANATTAIANANYQPTPLTPSIVQADARVYTSTAKAKAAFDALASKLKKCAGNRVEVSEPGSSDKWRVSTSVGEVPSLTDGGVSSLFIYSRESLAKGSTLSKANLASSYEVITLSGMAILVATGDVAGVSKLTAAQRDSVVSFATDFVGTWTKANS